MQVYIVKSVDHYRHTSIVEVYGDLESAESKVASIIIGIMQVATIECPSITSWVDILNKMNTLKSKNNNWDIIYEYTKWKDSLGYMSYSSAPVEIIPYVIGGGTPVTKIKCKMCKETLHSNEEYCWKCGLKLS